MEENRKPGGDYYELVQWKTLGCLIPVAIIVWIYFVVGEWLAGI